MEIQISSIIALIAGLTSYFLFKDWLASLITFILVLTLIALGFKSKFLKKDK